MSSISFNILRSRLVRAATAIFCVTSLFADTVQWDGGNVTSTGTGTLTTAQWNVASNWVGDSAPASGSDILIASGAFANATADGMAFAGAAQATNFTFGSISFDNQAGQFPVAGLRLTAAHANTFNSSIRYVYLNGSGGNILSATNNANVILSGMTSGGSAFNVLRLMVNFNGTANINVDATSSMNLTNGARFETVSGFTGTVAKTGAGSLQLGVATSNHTGGFNLVEGSLLLAVTPTNANTTSSVTTSVFGTGTLTLSGGSLMSNSTTARTILNNVTINGNVSLGNSTNSGVLTFGTGAGSSTTLAGNSTITAASDVTWAQNISGGAFSLTKSGTGSLTLSGTNSYTGGTSVTSGTLLGAIGSGALSISSGATYNLNSANRSVAALSGGGNVTLGSNTLTTSSSSNSTFSGVISGTGGLTKSGSGTLTLSGANDFTGSVSVTDGGLILNGSLASTSVSLSSGTTLSGSGTFSAGTVSLSGAHNPGNSPGLQTFNNLTYNNGSSVTWELAGNTASGAGTNFDQILVNGTLNFAGSTALALSFNAAGSTVNWNNTFWSSNQSWLVYDSATTTSFSNLSLTSTNWADGSGNLFNTVLSGASFALGTVGNDVYLNYTAAAVPEPSTYAALAGLAALGFAMWRRRRAAALPRAEA